MSEYIKIERYIGQRGSWFVTTDTGERYPCLHKHRQRDAAYHDPNYSLMPDGEVTLRGKKLTKMQREFVDALKGEFAVVGVSENLENDTLTRKDYVGRFRIADLGIDAEGLWLTIGEQVARVMRPERSPRARRGRGSY
jgi:hypothetical protein